ncbi:MAG: hypothetical protein H6719_15740 [Sandaracinaceae bacterium]|nr:hypothetical protein [Sandaracinaceae bacterium]
MRRLALASLALSLAACGPQRLQWQPRETAPEASSFAVVWAGASFHVAPDPRAPTISLAPPGAARAPWLGDTFVAVHVVRERDGWATVETLGRPGADHCVPDLPGLLPFRLRLHVSSRALTSVTVREVAQRFDDGTSIRLGRGVPLERLTQPHFYRARLGDLSTVVRLDPSEVGLRYLPSESLAQPGPMNGRLSIEALRAGVPILGQTGRVHSADATEDAPVAIVDMRGSEALVELSSVCGALRVRVPSHVIAEAPEASVDATAPAEPAPPLVEPGVPVFWPGGREAGVVSARVGLGHEVEAEGEQRCFGWAFHGGDEPTAVLCFRASDVTDPGAAAHGLAAPE